MLFILILILKKQLKRSKCNYFLRNIYALTIRINELQNQNIESLSAQAQRKKLQQKQDSCGRKFEKFIIGKNKAMLPT